MPNQAATALEPSSVPRSVSKTGDSRRGLANPRVGRHPRSLLEDTMAYRGAAAVAVIAAVLAGAPARAELLAENLLTNLPDGFKVGFQTRQGQMDMMEFVPAGETVEDWSAMVTVQVFHGQANADGDAFARRLAELWEGGCKGSKAERLDGGQVNRYPFVLWHYACPRNPQTGKPESMWLKAISGTDALYLVQYAYRAVPSVELERPALAYLAKASVCDTRKEDRACPPGM
jgi:hypothetical protein